MIFEASTRTTEAFDIASTMHQGQMDKGGVPILDHCEQVAYTLYCIAQTEDAFICGLLHDAVEDSDDKFTVQNVRDSFGDEVADVIDLATHTPNLSYHEYIKRIADSKNLLAIELKIVDLLCNTNPRRTTNPEQQILAFGKGWSYETALYTLIRARMDITREKASGIS